MKKFRQITEISQRRARDYAKRATTSATSHAYVGGAQEMSPFKSIRDEGEGRHRKALKRERGINRAIDKLSGNARVNATEETIIETKVDPRVKRNTNAWKKAFTGYKPNMTKHAYDCSSHLGPDRACDCHLKKEETIFEEPATGNSAAPPPAGGQGGAKENQKVKLGSKTKVILDPKLAGRVPESEKPMDTKKEETEINEMPAPFTYKGGKAAKNNKSKWMAAAADKKFAYKYFNPWAPKTEPKAQLRSIGNDLSMVFLKNGGRITRAADWAAQKKKKLAESWPSRNEPKTKWPKVKPASSMYPDELKKYIADRAAVWKKKKINEAVKGKRGDYDVAIANAISKGRNVKVDGKDLRPDPKPADKPFHLDPNKPPQPGYIRTKDGRWQHPPLSRASLVGNKPFYRPEGITAHASDILSNRPGPAPVTKQAKQVTPPKKGRSITGQVLRSVIGGVARGFMR